jgi:hypothetical protein
MHGETVKSYRMLWWGAFKLWTNRVGHYANCSLIRQFWSIVPEKLNDTRKLQHLFRLYKRVLFSSACTFSIVNIDMWVRMDVITSYFPEVSCHALLLFRLFSNWDSPAVIHLNTVLCEVGGLDCRTGSLHLGPCIRALCAPHWNSFLPSSTEALRTYRRERPLLAREGNWREFSQQLVIHRRSWHAPKLGHGTDYFTSPPKEGMLRIFSHRKKSNGNQMPAC